MSHLPVLLLYGVLTSALTWPLIIRLGEVVPFDLGDPLLSTWALWWNAHTMPFTSRWWDGGAFFPARETLTFSDHRLGLSLLTTPLIWLGVSPLASHNVAFLLSFVLSAIAAYALCFTLTRSRTAATIGGLVYGFNPFRAGHLPHLELLASYWLPVALLALHQWATTQKRQWLILVSVALTAQALTSGYYFAFGGVLIGLWLLWFTPRGLPRRAYVLLAVALGMPLLVIAPILLKYRDAHARMGLFRAVNEIEHYSADAIGLITAPEPLALWNSPAAWHTPEGALFPGLTAVVLVALALCARRAAVATEHAPAWWRRMRLAMLIAAAGSAIVAMIPVLHGPAACEIAGVHVSVSHPDKPLSVAHTLLWGWCLTSARVRHAWHRQSPLAFFVLATMAMWMFALGPTARVLGERVLYKAPYAWLMLLPGFYDEFRVPARFAMLAALTLSAAAAVAFWRLAEGRASHVRTVVACIVTIGILFDSWIAPFPLAPAPPALVVPATVPENAAILELPTGFLDDATAMYHATVHRRRTVNGMSGYEPAHYSVLREALDEGRLEAVAELAAFGELAIFIRRERAGDVPALLSRTAAKQVSETDTHHVLMLAAAPGTKVEPVAPDTLVPADQLASDTNPQDLHLMSDGDRISIWATPEGQRGGEAFTADLGQVLVLDGIMLAIAKSTREFPRAIAIDVSAADGRWTTVWQGDTAARTMAAAIADPREVRVSFPFARQSARYVRVTQTGQSRWPWAVAEFRAVRAPSE